MDVNSFLSKVHDNLQSSTDDLKSRWSKIFVEFQRKIQEEGSEKANEYLASRMGELDKDFSLYFIPFAEIFEKNGMHEAAEIQRGLAKGFLDNFESYRVTRVSDVAKDAKSVAEELSKKFKGLKV